MTTGQFIAQNLVHVAAVFTLVCFLFRNQIKLRIFAAIGDALLSVYYFTAFAEPLWNPMAWSILNVMINVAMILVILQDGRASEMSDDELSLFRQLDTLSPGQFRKLSRQGTWYRAPEPVRLTTEGEALDTLYFVLEGKIEITKQDRVFDVSPNLFIGELAFLRKRAATATVEVSSDAHYVGWNHDDLEKLLSRNDDLKSALHMLLSRDMAEKVANT